MNQTFLAFTLAPLPASKPFQLVCRLVLRACHRSLHCFGRAEAELNEQLAALRSHQDQLQLAFVYLFSFCLKETWAGPLCDRIPAESKTNLLNKQLAKEFPPLNEEAWTDFKQLGIDGMPVDLEKYDLSLLSNKQFCKMQVREIEEALSVGGELWAHHNHTPLFYFLGLLLQQLEHKIHRSLFNARYSFHHARGLDHPVGILQSKVQEQYEVVRAWVDLNRESLAKRTYLSFIAEQISSLLYFYKYENAFARLLEGKKALGVKYGFGARMGKRTKYQSFQTAQLVLDRVAEEYQHKERLQLGRKLASANLGLRNVQFEQDSILHEAPQYQVPPQQQQYLSEEGFIVLAEIALLLKSAPRDQMLFLQIDAFLNGAVTLLGTGKLPGLLRASLLYQRSQNEFQRMKRSQRAISQLQEILHFYTASQIQNHLQRTDYIFGSFFPSFRQFSSSLALKYLKMGLVVAGSQMFQQLGLMEECVESLSASRHIDRAQKLAEQLLISNRTPKLLCIIGDLKGKKEYYQQAWTQSKCKYARAKRSLGQIYFRQKKFQQSVEAFAQALQEHGLREVVQKCNQKISVRLPHAFLNLFGQAWGNLANCYSMQSKNQLSVSCLQQAVKHCQGNWRLWGNYLRVALQAKKFYRFFQCIERLIRLQHKELIDEEVLRKVNLAFQYKMNDLPKIRPQQVDAMQRRITRLYDLLKHEMGQKHFLWKVYGEFLQLGILKLNKLYPFYISKVFELQGDQDIQSYCRQGKRELALAQVQCKLKECNMITVVGWQLISKNCQQLQRSIMDLFQLDSRLGLKSIEIQMLAKNVATKIKARLEREPVFTPYIRD